MKFGGSGITEPLYTWIREHVPAGAHILELGSGDVSTPLLAQDYQVTSVEDNVFWLHRHSSHYIYAPLVNGWYDRGALKAQLSLDYALLLVDGPTGSEARVGLFLNLDLFRLDVPIIVDDTWRSPERAMALKLARVLGAELIDRNEFCILLPAKK